MLYCFFPMDMCHCLQVRSFSNRSNEQTLRLTSLDHLGVIAARLRKDAATSVEQDHEELINILAQVTLVPPNLIARPLPPSMLNWGGWYLVDCH